MARPLIIAAAMTTCLGLGLVPRLVQSLETHAMAGPAKQVATYFGNQTCAQKCHDFATVADVPAKGYTVNFSRRTELHTWYEQDKHKDAMKVLLDPRGQEIAKRMGIPGKLTDGKVWNEKWNQCLSCHGGVIPTNAVIDKSLEDHQDRINSGVSCVFCHGADDRWVTEHSKPVKNTWAEFNRKDKESQFGLADLWDPVKRASLCCECHVGNVAKGKVVTHEMYAAGHPPLPSFELATFVEAMPRHWETWPEKLKRMPGNQKLYEAAYQTPVASYEAEQIRMFAVSSLIALRESTRLVRDLAQKELDNPKAKDPAWPELAVFDCYACHHDLKTASWRQERASPGRPGRPQLRPWPAALATASANHAGQPKLAAEFGERWRDLELVFSKTPFGDPRAAADKSTALVAWADQILKALESSTFDKAASRSMLLALVRRPEMELLDFDSARQISWAVQSLIPAVEPAAATRPEVKEHFARLQERLGLSLPKGQVSIAKEFMPQVLQRIGAYDPHDFRKTMHGLAAELK